MPNDISNIPKEESLERIRFFISKLSETIQEKLFLTNLFVEISLPLDICSVDLL